MRFLLFALLFVSVVPTLFASSDGAWLTRVPPRERMRPNPYANDEHAVAAGAILFQHNCASCHGKTAQGDSKRPDLHSERVRHATDGELHWLLSNGNLKRGMPSWSRIPDAQRWQIVRYLRTLPVEVVEP